MRHVPVRRRALGLLLCAAPFALLSCGEDIPSRAEYREALAKNTDGTLTEIDDQLADCMYDKIHSDERLLNESVKTTKLSDADHQKLLRLLADCIKEKVPAEPAPAGEPAG